MKTQSYNGSDSDARKSLLLHLSFIRHGKTDPGNFRTYGKVCKLEGGQTSNRHEDAKETGVLSDCQFPGQLCSNWLPPKWRSMHTERNKTKSHVFLQIPKDFGPFQVDKAAHQESNLRKEEGSVPRNQRWSRSHLKCPSSKSGKLLASQHHHLSVISVMVIKKQNKTQQAERDETEDIFKGTINP